MKFSSHADTGISEKVTEMGQNQPCPGEQCLSPRGDVETNNGGPCAQCGVIQEPSVAGGKE